SSCLLAKYAPHATRRGSAECSHAPIWVESATVEMEICCPFAADKSDAAKMSAMEMRWNIIYEIPSQQDYFSHSRQSSPSASCWIMAKRWRASLRMCGATMSL